MLYVKLIEDSRGDLVDIEYFCSESCGGEAWPGGQETDTAKFCANCGDFIERGLQDVLVLSSHGEIITDQTGVIIARVFYCPDDGSCDCRGDWALYESIVPNEGSVHDGEVDILNCQITHSDGKVEPAIELEVVDG